MLCVHLCIGEDLSGIPVGKLEELVKDAWLGILHGGCGCQEEGDGPRSGWKGILGSRHDVI